MKEITPAQVAEIISARKRAVAITGAGISVESGIPDFRSPGGLWSRYDIFEYATIMAFEKNPAKVWVMLKEMDDLLVKARPNPAHYALAELERRGHLLGIVTQNVDNLHQEAGSKNVVEYHGNAHRFVCLQCKGVWPREALDLDNWVMACDLLLIIGTSMETAPANALPQGAKNQGAIIVENNLTHTRMTPYLTDYFLPGPAGEVWPRVMKNLPDPDL
ncbi:MAG: Sir2 family NAD-dependent protein deacetylase [Syntrophobacterales bacterium]